ncbi:MAG TPA: SDR family oxidoreductase [Chitinophagaceae bacterium]|jgi:short-subunit dehydrogenase
MNIIITGASKGLGKAIAERFAKAGNTLFVCSRNEVQLYKMMEELSAKYPQSAVKAKPADMSIKQAVREFAIWCMEFGTPDIIVNNAGQFLPGNVHSEEEGVLEKLIEANLYGAYHLTRLLLPKMMEAKSGHIFNMCSVAAVKAYDNGGAYSISKFALLGFSKNLREEMKPYNIKVTAVIPGAAYTDSWSSSGIDPKRFMEATDVAEMIYAASQLSVQACVEEILLRPQLGDI